MSAFTRISRGKIWFEDFGPCKRFDIFQLCTFCVNILKWHHSILRVSNHHKCRYRATRAAKNAYMLSWSRWCKQLSTNILLWGGFKIALFCPQEILKGPDNWAQRSRTETKYQEECYRKKPTVESDMKKDNFDPWMFFINQTTIDSHQSICRSPNNMIEILCKICALIC